MYCTDRKKVLLAGSEDGDRFPFLLNPAVLEVQEADAMVKDRS